jgi:hypothetical protein
MEEIATIAATHETVVAVLQAKIAVLERQLATKAENEKTAHLIAENTRLEQEKKELEHEIYEIQENNPELQAALEDRRELKRENGELYARVLLLEQQLNGDDRPLLAGERGDGLPLPFKRGLFREWQAGESAHPRVEPTADAGFGAAFVDAGAFDFPAGEGAFRLIGDVDDVGLFDEEDSTA